MAILETQDHAFDVLDCESKAVTDISPHIYNL